MNKIFLSLLLIPFLFPASSCKAPAVSENYYVTLETTLGDITLLLYNDTPLHRDNFIKLINTGFYEGISFHRVINSFMIQAGDPSTRTIPIAKSADSLNTYTIPAEFNRYHFHKRGALAAAREGNEVNPEMRSSGTHFYIVQGENFSDEELDAVERRINSNIKQAKFNSLLRQVSDSVLLSGNTISDGEVQEKASVKMFEFLTSHEDYKIPEDQRIVYKTAGGVPRLDGTYTVFGEVTEGLDIVDRIAAVKTDNSDKPLDDIKILKMRVSGK